MNDPLTGNLVYAYLDMRSSLQQPLVQHSCTLPLALAILKVDKGLVRSGSVSLGLQRPNERPKAHLPYELGHIQSLLYSKLVDPSGTVDITQAGLELCPLDPSLAQGWVVLQQR